jgi:hypothetical protein
MHRTRHALGWHDSRKRQSTSVRIVPRGRGGAVMLTSKEIESLNHLRWLGVALFVAAAVYGPIQPFLPDAVRGAAGIGAPYVQVVLSILWITAAIAMVWRIGPLWITVVFGNFAMLAHGMFVGTIGFGPGAPFLVSALVLAYVVVRTAPLFRRPIARVSG